MPCAPFGLTALGLNRLSFQISGTKNIGGSFIEAASFCISGQTISTKGFGPAAAKATASIPPSTFLSTSSLSAGVANKIDMARIVVRQALRLRLVPSSGEMKLIENFQPECEIGNRGEAGQDGRNDDECSTVFGENESRQAERQENEHEGRSHGDHLHPVAVGIGVIKQKDRQENEEEAMRRHCKQHARAKPPVACAEIRQTHSCHQKTHNRL